MCPLVRARRLAILPIALALLVVAACSSGSSDHGSASGGAAAPSGSDGARILADVQHLADEIGPRPAGSAQERQAADFLSERLRSLGYDVTQQEFQVSSEATREASLRIDGPQPRDLSTLPLSRSGSGSVQARLIAAGNGKPIDIPSTASGAVLLIARDGVTTFQEMASNARAAGALGMVVYNYEAGLFYGALTADTAIPAVGVSQADGQSLLAALRAGPVQVALGVSDALVATSRNVIARPPGRQCETVSGGHFDSVGIAPGASDNASGTATVLEIAALVAQRGQMNGNCFVLFGAEELGLDGSRYFVESLSAADKHRLRAMLNYDMTGVGSDGWQLVGSAELQKRAAAVAAGIGLRAKADTLPRGASSDHASFIEAGVPAVLFSRVTDNLLHTPQDVSTRVQPDLLQQAASFGVAMLEALAPG